MGDGAADDCPRPRLLVAVEDLSSSPTAHGSVLRYSLTNVARTACSSLTGKKQLSPYMREVTALPGDLVAAATTDGLYVVDAADSVKWTQPPPSSPWLNPPPVSVFPMHIGTQALVAVAYNSGAGADLSVIAEVDAFDATTAMLFAAWQTGGPSNSDIPLSQPVGMSADPFHPDRLLAVDDTDTELYAAVEVDPTAVNPIITPPYIPLPSDHDALRAIYSLADGHNYRTAWVGQKTATGPDRVYYTSDNSMHTGGIKGPITCDLTPCNSSGYHILYVAPDPTDGDYFFGVCEGPTAMGGRALVRFNTSSQCEKIAIDGSLQEANPRIWGIGIDTGM